MFGLPWHIVLPTLLGTVLAGLSCGLIGTFVVRLNLSSLGFAMSHAAFAGAALGLMLSIEPLWTALVLAVAVATLLGPLADASRLNPDAALGALFPIMMALGFVFLSRAPGSGAGASALSLLWGSVLGVTWSQVAILGAVAIVLAAAMIGFGKGFLALLLDRKLALSSGLHAQGYFYAVLLMSAVVVSVTLRITGGLLVYALIVLPANSAFQWVYDIKKVFILAPILGATCSLAGFVVSLWIDLPLGSAIALASAAVFLLSVLVSPKRRILSHSG